MTKLVAASFEAVGRVVDIDELELREDIHNEETFDIEINDMSWYD